MMKFNLGAHELHINEDLVSCKIVFNDDEKRTKSKAKHYISDFFSHFIGYHDINIYSDNEDFETFCEIVVCKSLKKNVLTFECDYSSRGILYRICNHFYTYVKTTKDKFFASKKYTFDNFTIQNMINYEDNIEVTIASEFFEYTLCKDIDGIWYLSDILEIEDHEYALLHLKLEVLRSDLNRFIIDNKFCFDLKHLPKIYYEMIIKPMLDKHCSIFTDNVINEKLLVLNYIVSVINNDKKVCNE